VGKGGEACVGVRVGVKGELPEGSVDPILSKVVIFAILTRLGLPH